MTKIALTGCVAASMLLTACARTAPLDTATSAASCAALEAALPTRSRADTAQTQAETGTLYNVAEAICPGIALPGS